MGKELMDFFQIVKCLISKQENGKKYLPYLCQDVVFLLSYMLIKFIFVVDTIAIECVQLR